MKIITIHKYLTSLFTLATLVSTLSREIIISCVGDSITAGSGASDKKTTSYPARLEKILCNNSNISYKVHNYGKGGTTVTKKGLGDAPEYEKMSYWDTSQYKEALNLRADIIIIGFGTNDAKRHNWNESSFVQDYVNFIDTFKSDRIKPKIFILVPPPLLLPLMFIKLDVVNERFQHVIPKIASIANVGYVNIFEAMGGKKGKRHLFLDDAKPIKWPNDGCHPNDLGYRVIALTIAKAILQKQTLGN